MPIKRDKQYNFVDEAAKLFQKKPKFKLCIAPEGTRGYVERWRTGFYHIAKAANVPIVLAGIDYHKKIIALKTLKPTGNIKEDFKLIFEFYSGMHGRYPKALPDISSV